MALIKNLSMRRIAFYVGALRASLDVPLAWKGTFSVGAALAAKNHH